MVHPLLPMFLGCIVTWAWSLAKGQYMVSWLLTGAPEQRYWQNRETANVGLHVGSSVGRAPARQSGGHRFKSRSSKFFFVHPNLFNIFVSFLVDLLFIHFIVVYLDSFLSLKQSFIRPRVNTCYYLMRWRHLNEVGWEMNHKYYLYNRLWLLTIWTSAIIFIPNSEWKF